MGTLVVAGVLAVATAKAAEKKQDQAKQEQDENLKKYDRNANGKLDPDEDAAMKADQAKEKRKKKG